MMAGSIRKEAEASAFICIKKKMSDCEKTVNFVMKAFLDPHSLLNRVIF